MLGCREIWRRYSGRGMGLAEGLGELETASYRLSPLILSTRLTLRWFAMRIAQSRCQQSSQYGPWPLTFAAVLVFLPSLASCSNSDLQKSQWKVIPSVHTPCPSPNAVRSDHISRRICCTLANTGGATSGGRSSTSSSATMSAEPAGHSSPSETGS